MKKNIISLAALLVVIVAAISAYWWTHTDHFKQHIVALINQINAEKSDKDASAGDATTVTTLHYEEISRSGFPFHASITLKNPSIITKNKADNTVNNEQSLKFLGDVVIAKNIFSSNDWTKAWIEADGKMPFPKSGAEVSYFLSGKFSIGCDCAENFILFDESMNPSMDSAELEKRTKEWIPELPYGFHIDAKNLCFCTESGAKLIKLDNASFKLNKSHPSTTESDFAYDLDVNKLDVFVKEIYRVTNNESKTQQNVANSDQELVDFFQNPITSDMIFKGHVTIPRGIHDFISGEKSTDDLLAFLKEVVVKVDDYKFSSKSDLWTINNKATMDLVYKDQLPFKFALAADKWVKFDPKFDQFLKKAVEIAAMESGSEGVNGDQQTNAGVIAGIANSIPNLSQFGKISFAADFDFQSKHPLLLNEEQAHEAQPFEGKLTVRKIALTSDLYGASLKADLDEIYSDKNASPVVNGQIAISIQNYQAFLQDSENFYNQLRALYSTMQESGTTLPDFPMTLVLNTIKGLSDTPNSQDKDVTTTIVIVNNVPTKVGTKNWLQLMPVIQPLMAYFKAHEKDFGLENAEDVEAPAPQPVKTLPKTATPAAVKPIKNGIQSTVPASARTQ